MMKEFGLLALCFVILVMMSVISTAYSSDVSTGYFLTDSKKGLEVICNWQVEFKTGESDKYKVCFFNNKDKATLSEIEVVESIKSSDSRCLWEKFKHLASASLKYLGNVAVRPEKIRIIGVRYSDGKDLIMRCDPIIAPINFLIMGSYYEGLSEWIFQGKPILQFPLFMQSAYDELTRKVKLC